MCYFSILSFSLFCLFATVVEVSESARILGVVPRPSYSHQVVFRPIWRELAKRGHELVVITTDPENDPNLHIREIDIGFLYKLMEAKYDYAKFMTKNSHNPIKVINYFRKMIFDVCKQLLLNSEVQNLLRNETEHFDLVIVEYMYPIMLGFAERFECPYIGVTTLDLPNFHHAIVGNPVHPVLYPDIMLPFGSNLTFWQRLVSTLFYGSMEFYTNVLTSIDKSEELMQMNFGKNTPPVNQIMKNYSMIFLNVNPAFYIRPLGPAFVLIGDGIHLQPLKPLPEDIQEYLDGAKNGVIYFSLGTNVKSGLIPPEMRKVMLETFKELPYRVLWKFDVDIPDAPENVKIVEWLPQQDILRHPNIKVFITQGGLQSMEEAIFSHVPVVGIPFIGDQDGNVRKIVRKGFGVHLDKNELTKESFKEAILEVINNPKYKQKTIEVAELSRDQPMTGLEKAVWWTEYVIRHKGAPHLRNPAIDLPSYQYYLLDVIGFVLAVLSVFVFIIYKIIVLIKKIILRIFRSSSKTKVKKQ